MYQRTRVAGRQETDGVPGFRQGVHAGASAWSYDGLFRRRVRRLLRVPAARNRSRRMSDREAILRKVRESAAVKQEFFENNADRIGALCEAMAQRFIQGRKLFVMGN